MDFRKEYLQNNLKPLVQPQTLWKAVTKPWKIPGAMVQLYKKTRTIMNDVKLKPLSTEYNLNTFTASVNALATMATEQANALPPVRNILEVFGETGTRPEDTEAFGSILKNHGSDKSTWHNYYIAYASILAAKKDQPLNILEIGLGTNNIDVMSNMGTYGRPGASLRSFRDMYPNATVFGADIDKRILFTEERITTYFVDQTDPATFASLKQQLSGITFDLIIDDGLHNSQANLNSTNFALDLLNPDGVFVVEDVGADDLPYYKITAAILKGKYSVDFLETKSGTCICIFKKINPA